MHTKRRPNNNMNGGGNGGGQHRHNNNRPRRFNNNGGGSRPGGEGDSGNVARTRRHAQQQKEKFQNMARDAMSMGDRVQAENYLQHADHYHRVILSLPPEEQRHQPQPRSAGADGADGHDGGGQQDGHGNDGLSDHGADSLPHSMPSADALPSFITQQPVGNHTPHSLEDDGR